MATKNPWLKKFVTSSSLIPYLTPGVQEKLANPIEFERQDAGGSQSKTYGYEATLLIDICDAILEANKTRAIGDPEDFKNITTEELKNIFIVETRRFMQGIDNGLSFDSMKKIRLILRQIEAELHERGVSL